MIVAQAHNFAVLLAAGGNVDIGWVVGVVIAILVAIFNAISGAAKKQEEKRRQQVRDALSNPMPPAVQPARRQPVLAEQIRMRIPKQALPRTVMAPPPAQPKKVATKKASTRPPALPKKATAAPRAAAAMVDARHQEISATEIRSEGAVKAVLPSGATADSIRRWLNPATLRQQFMLTEILSKPKALRDD